MKSPSNFERLVLGCIDSYDSNQILIFGVGTAENEPYKLPASDAQARRVTASAEVVSSLSA